MAMSGAAMLGAQAVGSASNLIGQIMANNMQKAATGKQMRWQDANIAKSMNFQREMRSTAYQTSVADMKAAGLNPMLLTSKGFSPSAAPPAPAIGAAQPQQMRNPMQGVSTALDLLLQKAQIDRINADTKKTLAGLPKTKVIGEIAKEGSDLWHSAKEAGGALGKWLGGKIYTATHSRGF